MIVDLFILIAIAAVVIMILAYLEDSMLLTVISMLLWIFLFANSMYIEIPYQAVVNNTINTGSQSFTETPLSIVVFGMLIINILMFLSQISSHSINKRFKF